MVKNKLIGHINQVIPDFEREDDLELELLLFEDLLLELEERDELFETDCFLFLSLERLLLLLLLSLLFLLLLSLLLLLDKNYEITCQKERKNYLIFVYDFLFRLGESRLEEGVLLKEQSFLRCPGLPHL